MHRLNYPATYKDRSFCPTQSPSWEASEVKHWEMRPSSLRNKQLNRLSNDFIAKIVQLHCTKISCVKTGLRCPRKFLNCFLPRCLLVTQTFDHNILIIENKTSRWRMDLYRLDTTRGSYNNFPYFKNSSSPSPFKCNWDPCTLTRNEVTGKSNACRLLLPPMFNGAPYSSTRMHGQQYQSTGQNLT